MKINNESICINYPSPTLAIVHSNVRDDIIYCLCKNAYLIQINTETKEVNQIMPLKLDKIDFEKSISLQLSDQDNLISITNSKGKVGCIYNLVLKEIALTLDRKDYNTEQTYFPIKFLTINNLDYLIHATDWNHLEIFDFKLKKNLTERTTNKYVEGKKNELYLDYFYGQLHLSPSKKWLLSSGWNWHPVSSLKFIDFNKWMNESKFEPEKENDANRIIMSNYWDRALCWIDDDTIAYIFDPMEEDIDKEEIVEGGYEIDTSYIMIYDVSKAEIKQKIKFNEYSKNEYFEATPDCRMYFDGSILISSIEKGLFILNKDSGDILFHSPKTSLSQYNKKNNLFYKLIRNKDIEIVRIST